MKYDSVEFPVGSRVKLVSMDDPYAKIPHGIEGTVCGTDESGTIIISWDREKDCCLDERV